MTHDDTIRLAGKAGLLNSYGDVRSSWKRVADFAELVVLAEQDRIIGLLKGIDQQDSETPDGWWETSTGAEFGARILEQIKGQR